jgi:predicted DNA-binding transcriptional regulator YafY
MDSPTRYDPPVTVLEAILGPSNVRTILTTFAPKLLRQTKLSMPSGNRNNEPSKRRKPDSERRLRQADRLGRILRVLQLIQGRGKWDVKSIAQEIECSERTVYRDLVVLELAGVPWMFDKETASYRIRPDYQFPVLNLTDEELVGQATATSLSQVAGLDVNLGARPTSEKLLARSKEKSANILSEAQRLTGVLDLKLVDHSQHRDFIRTVQWALIQKQQVTGQYRSPYEGKTLKLTLHPYRLCLVKSAWYLIGRMTHESQPRTFRIVRFKSLRMLEELATIPDDFDLRRYFGNAWGAYRGEQAFTVELLFDREIADVVTETVWHQTQVIRRHSNGTATLTFTIDGLSEIVRWILGWGGQVKVMSPQELRDIVLLKHRQAVSINEEIESEFRKE